MRSAMTPYEVDIQLSDGALQDRLHLLQDDLDYVQDDPIPFRPTMMDDELVLTFLFLHTTLSPPNEGVRVDGMHRMWKAFLFTRAERAVAWERALQILSRFGVQLTCRRGITAFWGVTIRPRSMWMLEENL
jgi:hypothetical protein